MHFSERAGSFLLAPSLILGALVVGGQIVGGLGCGAEETPASPAAGVEGGNGDVAESDAAPDRLVPLATGSSSSSALALARLGGRTVALLADEDDRALRMIDLASERELGTAALDGTPGHVVVDGSGGIHVALRDGAKVVSFESVCSGASCTLSPAGELATPAEPIALGIAGLGLAPESQMLLVSCGRGRALVGHPLGAGVGAEQRGFVARLGREPRGFALDDTGSVAIVAHAVGSRVTFVSLEDGAVLRERQLEWRDDVVVPQQSFFANVPRHAVQGFAVASLAGRAIIPMVLAYPGDPLTAAGGYGIGVDDVEPYYPHEPTLVTLDAGGAVRLRLQREVVDADAARKSAGRPPRPKGKAPCMLPRSAVVDAERDAVLVACFDSGEVIETGLEDAPLTKSERRRFAVGAGAVALALDEGARRAWVWSLLDRQLSSIALDGDDDALAASFAVPAALAVPEAAGRRVFHSAVAADSRACASCHIDGRDDGLSWTSPNGLVQTLSLAGRTDGTAPHGWRGESGTLEGHIKLTFQRLGAAKPSPETLGALARYVSAMPAYAAPVEGRSSEEERGRELFHSPELACTSCHATDGVWTDGTRRDVGTGTSFDTPSLRYLADSAPYMHDGRYETLRELLVATDGKMGYTRQLGDADMSALIAYLMTL